MAAQAKHLRPDDGKTYQVGRITINVKLSVADTGGAYTLCEAIEPPGAAAVLHRIRLMTRRTSSARATTTASSARPYSNLAPAR